MSIRIWRGQLDSNYIKTIGFNTSQKFVKTFKFIFALIQQFK